MKNLLEYLLLTFDDEKLDKFISCIKETEADALFDLFENASNNNNVTEAKDSPYVTINN